MRVFIYIFIILSIIGCKSTEIVSISYPQDKEFHPGACFYSYIDLENDSQVNNEKPFIIEIVDAQYKDYEIRFTDHELDSIYSDGGSTQLITRYAHSNLQFVNTANLFHLVYKISGQKIISHPKIVKRRVRDKPASLSENQMFFEGGEMSEVMEVKYSHHMQWYP